MALLIATSTLATTGRAQEEPETVNTLRGPITGSTRRIGLGGAFVALADDTEGVAINPASVALRLPYSWQAWDWGVGLDVAVGAWLPKNDVYNQASDADDVDSSAFFGSLAALVNYNHAGFGVSAEAQRNATSREDRAQGISDDFAANFGMVHANLGYGFLDGQLLIGAGSRIVGMSFDRKSESGLLSSAGAGYETGVIIKPEILQLRIAVAYKSAIDAKLGEASETGPSTLHVPWEASVGFAYQFGTRPLNPRFVTAKQIARLPVKNGEPSKAAITKAEHDLFERYLERQRWYLLVSSELSVLEGGGEVGISGQPAKSGPVISPRLGVESEVIPHHLRLRAGSYYEPSLLEGTAGRFHGTGGFDVKLFEWSIFGLVDPFDYWQLSISADGARQYLSTAFSIGFWH